MGPQERKKRVNGEVTKKTLYPGGTWEPGEAQYGHTEAKSYTIRMKDNTSLTARVSFPTELSTGERARENFPVVIEFTSYVSPDDPSLPIEPVTYLTEHGYISVTVLMRGAGGSEGEVNLFGPQDCADGADLVHWASRELEGSDGRVAFIGCSYPAGLALAAAAGSSDPALKAIIPTYNGLEGVFRQCWATNGHFSIAFMAFTAYAPEALGNSKAAKNFFEKMRNNILSGEDRAYAGDFWKERLPMEMAEKIVNSGVAVLLQTGFKDLMDRVIVRNYIALQNAYAGRPLWAPMEKGQAVSPKYQLLMGNWAHGEALDLGIFLQWLDTWVKGIDTGLQNVKTPAHLWEGGDDRWFNADCYPPVKESTQFYLRGDGKLGRISEESSGSGQLTYVYPHEKNGLLSFRTEEFEKDVRLAGAVSATIFAASSGKNLVLLPALYDVSSSGEKELISQGVVVGSLHRPDRDKSWTDEKGIMTWPWLSLEKDEYLTPGEVYRMDIPLAPRQWKILKGHRLELEITAKSPVEVLPENGMPQFLSSAPGILTKPQKETIEGQTFTIYFGASFPSSVNLPIAAENTAPYVETARLPTAWVEPRVIDPKAALPIPIQWG